MGYLTKYKLSVSPSPSCKDPNSLSSIQEIVTELNNRLFYGHNLPLDDDGSIYDSCKWYEWHDDMKKFSSDYPNILFTLSGLGEQSGDIWTTYFVDGKSQIERAKIVIGEFNKSKLS